MIKNLIEKIENKEMLTENMFKNKDIDSMLDERDSCQIFNSNWQEIYKKTKETKLSFEVLGEVEQLSNLIFDTLSEYDYIAELPEYIECDMRLIATAFLCNINSKWLDKLKNIYLNNIFPYGDIMQNYPNL